MDEDFLQRYESVSTLMIRRNQGPIVINNNTFSENIGTMGGAIHIYSPDFESNADSEEVNSHPYIYISGNTFDRNMAYFAGNALYVAHTVRKVYEYQDYRNMCGAGVHVDSNVFEGNIGLKKHNGGAAIHRCLYLTDDEDELVAKNHTSSLELA